MTRVVKALFAADTDCAELLADILTGQNNSGSLYCLLHNCRPEDVSWEVTRLSLCLPVRRPGGAEGRCAEVFKIKLPTEEAGQFLFNCGSLSAKQVYESYSKRAAYETFQPILEVLGLSGDEYSIKNAVTWGRGKFVASLRKYFKLTTSPHWFINTFGAFENHFVLVSSCYYFFPVSVSTVDTLCHLAMLYSSKKGCPLSSITTLRELGAVATQSPALDRVENFYLYVCDKLARDTLECEAVDRCINEFRGQLMLSDQDLVHYIYLSFFQCFNNQKFLAYSQCTNPCNLNTTMLREPMLVANIDSDFKHKMATYYNKNTYLSNYVLLRGIHLHPVVGYGQECLRSAHATGGHSIWWGESHQVSDMLKTINVEYPDICLHEEFRGLMDLAAITDRCSIFGNPIHYLTDCATSGAIPIYRSELSHRHYFLAVFSDDIEYFWKKTIFLPPESFCLGAQDTMLTRAITYTEMHCSMSSVAEQIHVSRHEYFNPKLPVFNWVLDLDLPISEGNLHIDSIYSLCLLIRESVLDILKLLGPVEPDHEVFFFKSACINLCDPGEASWRPSTFCTCTEKLGMRVVTRFPPGICLKGSEPLTQLTKILNRVIKLGCGSLLNLSAFQLSNGPFDVGIYGRGRSIRLPHTYKVGKCGQLERLLKLFVCHPEATDKFPYLQNSLKLNRLLHHAQSQDPRGPLKIIYRVEDINEDFLYKHTQKQLPVKHEAVIPSIERLLDTSLNCFLLSKVWPKCFGTIRSYMSEEKLQQFSRVVFHPTNHCIVQVRPDRGNNFKCLRYNHRGSSKSVRVFLILHLKEETKLIVTFMSQCFANKCQSNKAMAHFSVFVDLS
ncbi:primase [Alcelaphine gammaherpesvirus 1]|uniref:DNA primase n=1 Tax=Alcelaphine herpesvirus 1 (strain C500) TaxID=654901 RepID=PRIM_ALHV1|nr:primase [Alcelaphine gammaherpesvirus 1]O36406.1 RecName: Full=DNA primase [Alcelaphine herpesvirus 1 strain C500]AAC58103.1 primase [Alcelaphine gammaherpesvirus 1]APB09479.1 helicase-primase primase subunit [Alcelaphine gammaherpesvirus 1]APB09551.1 helicase-primase primase subunit [Alcelaphine gammaherpesvirus 1]ATI21942.1 ORF56 [Alcelaphine gammaherpesvirus 1]QDY92289.1 helicase-primase primase subunit [Alcelaphine gammaherpesvirus 1]